ncbi:hypothetical protein STRMA_0101 [Streptococcus macacae NCTC 11558]|uniref:Uncharacterized protein n=2 Tax=Streptococcus macacae TaxID=1339 RepID=G5JY41_9STRE|nr:hypothetical protein STRMA_0101 [Streptococcus macacae NCTC 11558]
MLLRFEKNGGVIKRQVCLDDKRAVEIVLTDLGYNTWDIINV